MSTPKFKVGEIAIINSKTHPRYNGNEVEVKDIRTDFDDGMHGYRINPHPLDNSKWVAESALKKLPPKDDLTTWEAIQEIWKPQKIGEQA